MRTVLVIGIGAGNPEHITMQAVAALNRADVLFIPDKGAGKEDLAGLRREIVARYGTNPSQRQVSYAVPRRDAANPSYEAGVGDWHAALAGIHARLLAEHLPEGGTGAFLVWGDPSLYDSTLRILAQAGVGPPDWNLEVIPGITSIQALAAAHAIPLNRIGEPVTVTTGRRLAADGLAGDTVVLLDGRLAFTRVEAEGYDIFWGAYLGTPDQILVSGPLAEVAGEIEAVRARARAAHGWIMDTYLLRRRDDSGAPAR